MKKLVTWMAITTLMALESCTGLPKQEIVLPTIEAEGKAEDKGLTFQWSVTAGTDEIKNISVVVRKGDNVLQSADTIMTTGTYFITPYSEGTFSLQIQAETVGTVRSEKAVTIETQGNLPSPCPSRQVWMPPKTEKKLKGLLDYSLGDLIELSSLIFAGKVVHIEFCHSPNSSIPFTFVTFSDLSVIHGTYSPPELTLAFAGGVMDGKVSTFIDVPQFLRGERYVLFLTARSTYRLTPTVGWSSGVLVAEKDGIMTYSRQPVVGIEQRRVGVTTSEIGLMKATDVEPQTGAVDPVYGSHKVIEGERPDPARRKLDAPRATKGTSEARFTEELKSLIRKMQLPTPPQGRLLNPGTPFEWKPGRGATPPQGRRTSDLPQHEHPLAERTSTPQQTVQFPRGATKAYGFYVLECFGDIMKWTGNDATMKRLPISFPSASSWANALIESEARWNVVPGHAFEFNDAVDNDNTWESGEDGNEVAFAFSDDIDGAFAVTYLRHDSCGPLDDLWPGHNIPIDEGDVLFNVEDFDWDPSIPDPRQRVPSIDVPYFRPVALHELGHALGLSGGNQYHEDRSIATMNSAYPVGGWYSGVGTQHVIPHGDDRAGIRFIYPAPPASETDIAVLNFAKLNSSTAGAVLVNPVTPDRVCPGNRITVQYNFGNIGTVPVDFDLGFYLSTDLDISTSDIFLASEEWYSGLGLGSYGPGVLSRTLTIPSSVAFNTEYFVGVFSDFRAAVAEAEESNNSVALPGSIRIKTETACAQPPQLTVTKTIIPSDDPGRFNLRIDSVTRAANVSHGGSTGPVIVSPGSHSVSEAAGTGTKLSDYIIRIGGTCTPDGSITLVGGDSATCTITNVSIAAWRELCEMERDLCFAELSTPGGLTAAQCLQLFNACLSDIE